MSVLEEEYRATWPSSLMLILPESLLRNFRGGKDFCETAAAKYQQDTTQSSRKIKEGSNFDQHTYIYILYVYNINIIYIIVYIYRVYIYSIYIYSIYIYIYQTLWMKLHKIQLYGQGNCGPGYARWARLSVRNLHWLSHDMFQYGDTLKWLLKCWKIRVNLGSLKSIYLDFSDKPWQTYVFGLSWVDLLNLRLFSKFAQNSVWKESSPRCQPLSFVRLLASPTSLIVSAVKVQETLQIHKDSKGPQRPAAIRSTQHYTASALPCFDERIWIVDDTLTMFYRLDRLSMHHAKRGVTFKWTLVISGDFSGDCSEIPSITEESKLFKARKDDFGWYLMCLSRLALMEKFVGCGRLRRLLLGDFSEIGNEITAIDQS